MARTAEGAALTRAHRRRQLALRALTLQDLIRLWPLWDPADIASYQRFVAAASVLIRARHRDSAGLASRYYRAFRTVEDVEGTAEPELAPPLLPEEIVAALRATGLAATLRAVRAGFTPQAARQSGLVAVSGSAGRLVLNGGRDTVIGSARADRRALGWSRVTDGSPCYFCAMLASRGPVYESADTATTTDEGGRYHDHCACGAEPHFAGAAWPGRSREFEQLWAETTGGLSGADARNAFRRAYEGRT